MVSGMSQADAYRAAYNAAKMKPESVQRLACALMKNIKVTSRVEELRKPVIVAAQITLTSHLNRLQELSKKAEEGNQLSAAIAAEVARGKASGLYVEKVDMVATVTVTHEEAIDSLR